MDLFFICLNTSQDDAEIYGFYFDKHFDIYLHFEKYITFM